LSSNFRSCFCGPAFSGPYIWSFVFWSCIFSPPLHCTDWPLVCERFCTRTATVCGPVFDLPRTRPPRLDSESQLPVLVYSTLVHGTRTELNKSTQLHDALIGHARCSSSVECSPVVCSFCAIAAAVPPRPQDGTARFSHRTLHRTESSCVTDCNFQYCKVPL